MSTAVQITSLCIKTLVSIWLRFQGALGQGSDESLMTSKIFLPPNSHKDCHQPNTSPLDPIPESFAGNIPAGLLLYYQVGKRFRVVLR